MKSAAQPRKRKPPERDTVAQLRTELRGAGLRSTGPRVAVLGSLSAASTPRSHGDIAEALAPLGYDRATIYRNLMDLTQAGLVTRTDLGDHVWRFELRRGGAEHTQEHPHLVCTDCGDVSCLPEVEVKIVARPGARRPAGALEVQLKGLCEKCE